MSIPIKKKNTIKEDKSQLDMLKMIAGDIKGNITFEEKNELRFTPARLLSYNRASVFGGYPTGGIYEIHGPNGGGKTALGIEILTSAQKAGHLVAFFDLEKAANDKRWITALGLDLSKCMYRNKSKDGKSVLTLEESADEINDMIISFNESKHKGTIPDDKLLYILFDSVASACPAAKLKKGAKVGDANYGLVARLMSDWLQTLNALAGGSDVAVIFINQERCNVGAKSWEPKFKSFGGEALQFYASIRIRVSKSGDVKEKVGSDEIVVGRQHRFKIEKNKLGYPAQEGYFYTSNGLGECELGFDDIRSTIEEALLQETIYKTSTTSYESKYFEGKMVGERKLRDFLRNNPKAVNKIKDETYKLIMSGTIKMTTSQIEDDNEENENE